VQLWRQVRQYEALVFSAQVRSHAHLLQNGFRFARRQILGRNMTPTAMRLESFFTFCALVRCSLN